MKVGIPKGLLYYKYHTFFESFFTELGADIVLSPDTNKEILDAGIKHCVDEACLPVKIFHGHIYSIKDKCDVILIPRIMQLQEREFICPKFCGLPEMVLNSISPMPKAITAPIYAVSKDKFYTWAKEAGKTLNINDSKIKSALSIALQKQERATTGIKDKNYPINIALAGHPYNVYDDFVNMNLMKKLNKLGVGVITEEFADDSLSSLAVSKLYKKPFWTFARNNYGFAIQAASNNSVQGIIYISSFACGIDSVVIQLINDKIQDFPFMVLKIDEHTGEAGLDTRIEAFVDMLERSIHLENNISSSR